MKDETLAGFFQKYNGQRARPGHEHNPSVFATLTDQGLQDFLETYTKMSVTGVRGDGHILTSDELKVIDAQIKKMRAEIARRKGVT